MSNTLMDGASLARRLEEIAHASKKMVIISAYLTESAVDWIKSIHQDLSSLCFVGRFNPRDFISGSSDLAALRQILDNGWTLKYLPNLHAKIYLVDDFELFVGSANFTASGLKLSGAGNIEAVIEKVADEKDLIFIHKLVNSAKEISHETLDRMESLLVGASDLNVLELQSWPDEIISFSGLLFVSDFPLSPPEVFAEEYVSNPSLPFAIINGLTGNSSKAAEQFKKSKAFNWLLNALRKAEGRQMYFGAITAFLHDSVADDPAPYRRSVKDILSNLLQYIEYLNVEEIEITRPSYSQLVKLL